MPIPPGFTGIKKSRPDFPIEEQGSRLDWSIARRRKPEAPAADS